MKSKFESSRIQDLNNAPLSDEGEYILYWMQQSQRCFYNHALEHALEWSRELELPVVVAFVLMDDYPEANERHFAFMLEGLLEVKKELEERNIAFVLKKGEWKNSLVELANNAALLVTDRGYLRHQRKWRKELAGSLEIKTVQVETDVIVPVEEASPKQEYAARTIRPKLNKQYQDYLVSMRATQPGAKAGDLAIKGMSFSSVEQVLKELNIDRSVKPVSDFTGGTSEAKKHFGKFLNNSLGKYPEYRNQPQTEYVSYMSMYLHFGQISAVWLALQARKEDAAEAVGDFIEELLVRRELAANFVYYTKDYDSFSCLPDWAKKTLKKHDDDERPYYYSRDELEAATTHDAVWNAAMEGMKKRGYLHNYMRMYWGKKILEWSSSSEYAYKTALYLNNKYFLDGRDCNSYANIAWIFGLHDRAWQERPVYGKVRTMTQKGLERKFDTQEYIDKIRSIGS